MRPQISLVIDHSMTTTTYLWDKFDFEFTGQVLTLKLLVLANVGRNHALDLKPKGP